ncbi:putative transposon Ty3-I Gag-Pol polyprotein [Apostichopus japonicus]|uniref:Putative transposon Ty3-I Gag-Pol polyprotein n=1 Tax=Stichopus japonicus TaxID=307972 RepID=A0A2G8JXR9_STIJA|nr:putative transposon Ty3-I Gag-Pol polyprotein [Apostichopus japonicus]
MKSLSQLRQMLYGRFIGLLRSGESCTTSQQERHDLQQLSPHILVGSTVLLKKCAHEGRHKLEDKYNREPFIVVGVNEGLDVYSIRPLLGGAVRTVNRRLLILDPRQPFPYLPGEDSQDIPEDVVAEEGDLEPDDWGDDDVDEDMDRHTLIPYWMFHEPRREETTPQADPPCQSIRRSARTTKGQHSNPTHLPRSSIPNP